MSNHIDHIEITNFKSIRHQKIEGCKRINVFIGYPNVGKSAILEAMSALSYLQKYFDQSFANLCRIKGSSELFYDGNVHNEITIKVEDNVKVGFRYLNEITLDFAVSEKLISGSSLEIEDWRMVKNLRFSNEQVDRASNSMSNKVLTVRKYLYQNNLLNYKTDAKTLEFPSGKNLVDIVQSNKVLRKEVSELFKFYNLKLSIDQGNNSIKALKELDDETIFLIPFYQMADTLQRLIFHKAAIMSNENAVLLFEEPEAHMFPPYIRKFTGDVIFDKSNNQFFISTHSPIVVEDFLEDAREDLSVYLVGLKNGETIIKRLSDEELTEVYEFGVDLFFNIESYLDK